MSKRTVTCSFQQSKKLTSYNPITRLSKVVSFLCIKEWKKKSYANNEFLVFFLQQYINKSIGAPWNHPSVFYLGKTKEEKILWKPVLLAKDNAAIVSPFC